MKPKSIVPLTCAAFIFLFLYTALSKLLAFSSFVYVLGKSPFIGTHAPAVAWMVPVSEIIIACLLLLPSTQLKGLYAGLLLILVFTIYIALMLLSGQHLPCACGGVISRLSWKGHLLFNSFLLLLFIIAIYYYRKGRKPKTLITE